MSADKMDKERILAYRQCLRGDGFYVPYTGNKEVDRLTTESIKLVEHARVLLAKAAEECTDP